MRHAFWGAAALSALVVSGGAEARPDVRQMTCAQANALVAERGVVVMTTGRYTYRRFVSDVAYCEFDQRRRAYVVKSRDNPRCQVRGICDQSPFYDLPGFGD
ncbi:MAG: hypothetical protein AAGF49_11295 [Pseudomonadota bacterium]